MLNKLENLIIETARSKPDSISLIYRNNQLDYGELAGSIEQVARGLIHIGLAKQERVAIYLPKRFETVQSFFGTSLAGGVFVPLNPLLKAEQVSYILCDCNVRILVTTKDRVSLLSQVLTDCHDLQHIIVIDANDTEGLDNTSKTLLTWDDFIQNSSPISLHRTIDTDIASILYTSGSTGKPKGVVLSHLNMVTGAESVAQYLKNSSTDRLLAVLPFSFDYGFSQLSTAFHKGASVMLMDYLLPRDVINAVAKNAITGLAAVPPLWIQLAKLEWPEAAKKSLRYITNSGGAMPVSTLKALRSALSKTDVYLMYGLTEAFRSTYLDPAHLDNRPESMGKAIPNAEILVVREDGTPCAPGEPGELVHRGPLVAMGYWGDKEKTAERFRPAPGQDKNSPSPEIAVWSGDTVRMDEEGFLYFISRKDEMIKTSGYRVSPTEIEEVVYRTGHVGEVVALGIPHPSLGQGIILMATPPQTGQLEKDMILAECKKQLPSYMVPADIIEKSSLPRNPNGKIDRKALSQEVQGLFQEE